MVSTAGVLEDVLGPGGTRTQAGNMRVRVALLNNVPGFLFLNRGSHITTYNRMLTRIYFHTRPSSYMDGQCFGSRNGGSGRIAAGAAGPSLQRGKNQKLYFSWPEAKDRHWTISYIVFGGHSGFFSLSFPTPMFRPKCRETSSGWDTQRSTRSMWWVYSETLVDSRFLLDHSHPISLPHEEENTKWLALRHNNTTQRHKFLPGSDR